MGIKYRNADSAYKALAEEKSWRILELKGLLQAFDRQPENAKYIGRAFIAMLYAHWEGFVKRSTAIYLGYLHDKQISAEKLIDPLLGILLSRRQPELSQTRKFAVFTDVVSFIRCPTGTANLDLDMTFITANLKSDSLLEIVNMLGFSFVEFEQYRTFIDNDLVELRHRVAHGSRIERTLDKVTMQGWYEKVGQLIDIFKTKIENAIALETFLTN